MRTRRSFRALPQSRQGSMCSRCSISRLTCRPRAPTTCQSGRPALAARCATARAASTTVPSACRAQARYMDSCDIFARITLWRATSFTSSPWCDRCRPPNPKSPSQRQQQQRRRRSKTSQSHQRLASQNRRARARKNRDRVRRNGQNENGVLRKKIQKTPRLARENSESV